MRIASDALRQIQALCDKDPRYKTQAYLFVLAGLDATLRTLNRHEAGEPAARHVTGQELSRGLRDFAVAEYGPSARMVLEHWGLRSTLDFGHVVYNLISAGLMGKSETDSLSDFENVFDFHEELERKYRFNLDLLRSGSDAE